MESRRREETRRPPPMCRDLLVAARNIYTSALQNIETKGISKTAENDDSSSSSVDEEDLLKVTVYNAACVSWRLDDKDACKRFLVQYISMEKETRTNTGSAVLVPNLSHTALLDEIARDTDFQGINEWDWFLEEYGS